MEHIETEKALKDGVMLALFLPQETADQLNNSVSGAFSSDADIIEPSQYHVTLTFMGEISKYPDITREAIERCIERTLNWNPYLQINAKISGVGRFNTENSDGKTPVYASVDSEELSKFRENLTAEIGYEIGVFNLSTHGFTPHITLAYIPSDSPMPDVRLEEIPIVFTEVALAWGDERTTYRFERAVRGSDLNMSTVLVKSIEETPEGDVIIPVIGVPFGSKDKRDVHGDFFDKSTDVGPLNEFYSYFDHGRDAEWLPTDIKAKGFGKQLIGIAKKDKITDEGIIYNIIVDRRHKYKSLIKRLAEEGHLDASSAVRFRENDKSVPGRIQTWHVNTVDLTPTPASPDAMSLMKSLFEEILKEEGNLATEKTEEVKNEEAPVSVTDQIDAMLKETEKSTETEEVPVQNGSESEILALLKSISGRLDNIEGVQNDFKEALPKLGQLIAKSIKLDVSDEVQKQKSTTQIDVEKQIKSANIGGAKSKAPIAGKLPASAPGMGGSH